MKIYNFPVVITQDEDDMYIATVHSLPGCHTQGKTMSEIYDRIKEAIELYLEVQREKHDVIIPQEKFIGMQQIEVAV